MKNVTNKILKYMHKMGLYSYFYLITNKESCRINLCFIILFTSIMKEINKESCRINLCFITSALSPLYKANKESCRINLCFIASDIDIPAA